MGTRQYNTRPVACFTGRLRIRLTPFLPRFYAPFAFSLQNPIIMRDERKRGIRMFFRSLIALLVLGLGLALAACGDNQPASTSPAATLAATTVATKPSPTPGNAVTATATADTNSSTTPISQKPGSTEQSLEFEGRNRTYVLHLPPAITAQKPLPLL